MGLFLIQYDKGLFIDGNDIQWLKIEPNKIIFILKSDPDHKMLVGAAYQEIFVNNLEGINDNIDSTEAYYHKNKKA